MADEGQKPPVGEEKISFLKEAFNSQYNWIGMTGAVAFAIISGNPLPLLLAAGLELMYLSIIPNNPRYQRLVRMRKYAEAKRQAEAHLGVLALHLPPDMRKRYEALLTVCAGIRANYRQLSATSQIFAGQMEERLVGLVQGFMRLLVAAHQHREYLASTAPAEIQREMAQLQRTVAAEPPKVQEINRRRIEILEKRLEKFRKISENRQVIDAQCAAMEDVLQLIRDQSVTMKDPRQVSDQLGELVRDVEQTEETIRQVEAILDTAAPVDDAPSGGTGSGARGRVRS